MTSEHLASAAPDPMDEGLRAAFGEALPPRPSLLRLLQQKANSRLDLHLQDEGEESDVPVRIDDETEALRDPAGRYQVLGEIGRGGVGIVYKGRDQDLGRDVAMKVLRDEFVARPEILERFVEEAQIGGQLQHPGIVPVYELGLQHGQRPYFAMKLVKGETLAALLGRRADPGDDRRRFLGIFEQVCQTLAYAHARRVVHRDLKPANVMIGSFGEVQVVDWGFAKVLPKGERADEQKARSASSVASVISTVRSDPQKGTHSVVGSMLGTPAYMPPEQAIGDVEHMDERSDVFGLGAMLCEILTGSPPYLEQDGDLIQQAARAELQGAYERIEQSGADPVLVTLCKQCLSPARKARPESAKQVTETVGQYLHSVEERARQAQIHAAEARVRARSTMLLSAAAVLLLALGGGGYLLVQHEAQLRRDQATQRVAAALNEANVRLGEARAAGPAELGSWTRALDTATQADHLAADPDVGGDQRTAVLALVATVRSEQSSATRQAARIARETTMRRRLLAVRGAMVIGASQASFFEGAKQYADACAAAFFEYLEGRDLTTMSVEAGVAALRGPMAIELAAALDDWAHHRRQLARLPDAGATHAAAGVHLVATAIALDPDPWRTQLRRHYAEDRFDREGVVRLHADADLPSLPAVSSNQLALALWDVDSLPEARAVLRAACERHPDDFTCVVNLGRVCMALQDWAEAGSSFRIARALHPECREVLAQLGLVAEALGDHGATERAFRELVEAEPAQARWHFQLAKAYQSLGKLTDAAAGYRRAIELAPNEAVSHRNLGMVLQAQGRFAAAVAAYQRAIELDPNDARSHNELGIAREWLDQLELAIDSYRRAIELDPKYAAPLNNLAVSLAKLGRYDEAVPWLRRAIELQPTGAAHSNLGGCLRELGETEQAIASFERAIALEPGLADAHWNLGMALGAHGEPDRALASCRCAREIWTRNGPPAHPDPEQAAAVIDRLEADASRLPDQLALARGERGDASAPDFVAAASLVYRRRDYALSVSAYGRAFEAFPELLAVHPHRYDAACAAALAGVGKGQDATGLPEAERARLREQARVWLAAELERWRRDLALDGGAANAARRQIAHSLEDPDFAGVRTETSLQALPASEAEAWRTLWQDIGKAAAGKEQGK